VTRIRLASADDAGAIARVQIAAWRAAYADIVPAQFLASLDVGERVDRWRTRISPAADSGAPTFVALDTTDAVRGFAHSGPIRDDDLSPEGRAEVYTVYVDPVAWRRGIGSTLMTAVDDFWGLSGIRELVLWTFEDNPAARTFYEQLGYTFDGTRKIDDFGGTRIAEVRYRRRMPIRFSPAAS